MSNKQIARTACLIVTLGLAGAALIAISARNSPNPLIILAGTVMTLAALVIWIVTFIRASSDQSIQEQRMPPGPRR